MVYNFKNRDYVYMEIITYTNNTLSLAIDDNTIDAKASLKVIYNITINQHSSLDEQYLFYIPLLYEYTYVATIILNIVCLSIILGLTICSRGNLLSAKY